jgi:adenosylmethionine---8-amino-7-oxononanoate aminotransferase
MKQKLSKLQQKDLQYLWHPYTQMQTSPAPIAIVSGKGANLYDEKGKKYIDAIASWWQNIHGHAHPYLSKRLYKQSNVLEHVIFANFTHKPAVELAERILKYLPENITKIFYSDNGSTSVEVAIKMAIQYFYNLGEPKKRFIAFKNAYHGDTFAAMAVASPSIFNQPFSNFLFEVDFIDPPTKGKESESLKQLAAILNCKNDIAGFIFEPLVQGAAGMKMHSASGLDDLLKLCKVKNIICIADEIMTAFYRTGKFLATDFLINKPDIICLSKGLTSGMLPLGITACAQFLYDGFLSKERSKAFFHGHSCTANPLATTIACASLDLLERLQMGKKIACISTMQAIFILKISKLNGVKNPRQQGIIAAFDWQPPDFATEQHKGWAAFAYQFFIKKGIILRPLGTTIYILPPYCIKPKELEKVYAVIFKFLSFIQKKSNFKNKGSLYC